MYGPNFAGIIEALREIISFLSNSNSGIQRTPTLISTSTSGTVTTGKISVAIANVGVSDGTVLGVTLPANTSVSYEVLKGETLAAVSYDATGTTFLIAILT